MHKSVWFNIPANFIEQVYVLEMESGDRVEVSARDYNLHSEGDEYEYQNEVIDWLAVFVLVIVILAAAMVIVPNVVSCMLG